jgi:hypothetical protein
MYSGISGLLDRIATALGSESATKREGVVTNTKNLKQILPPVVWSAVLERIQAVDGDFEYLGAGQKGSAHALKSSPDRVVKFTVDDTEARAMAAIKGKHCRHLVNVHDVFSFQVGVGKVYCILQERLERGDQDWKDWGEIATFYFYKVLDKIPFTPIAVEQFENWCTRRFRHGLVKAEKEKFFKKISTEADPDALLAEVHPNAQFGDMVREGATMPSKDFFLWFHGLCDELTKNGIEFYDLNAGNMMKRGKEHVVIDLGYSTTYNAPRIEEITATRELYQAVAESRALHAAGMFTSYAANMQVPDQLRAHGKLWGELSAVIGHDVKKPIEHLGGLATGTGTMGDAYLLSNGRVLKITKDKSEAQASAKVLGRDFRHIVRVFNVFEIDAIGQYAIVLELLEKPGTDWAEFAEVTAKFFLHQLLPIIPETVQRFEKEWKQARGVIASDQSMDWADINPGDDVELKTAITWPELPGNEKFVWLAGLAADLEDADIQFSDLNPGNIMLRPDGHYVITDLGVSRIVKGIPAIQKI